MPSIRLQNWDYSNDGAYFFTACTKNKGHHFGKIRNAKLIETKQSKICMKYWLDLPKHYANCILDEFIIMPNHVHGIIFIDNVVPVGQFMMPYYRNHGNGKITSKLS